MTFSGMAPGLFESLSHLSYIERKLNGGSGNYINLVETTGFVIGTFVFVCGQI
jgi:hypothetical protein